MRSKDRAWLPTYHVACGLARCEILFGALDSEQMEGLGLDAEIATRLRSVR